MLRLPHDLERLPSLFDERSRPDFRTVFGLLSRRSTWIDVAVTRIRFTTLDLTENELSNLRRLRLMVAQVNAATLDTEAHALLVEGEAGRNLRYLGGLLERGRIEARAAPLGGWSPDFTVFGDRRGPRAVLLGFHWFQRPYPHRGPALASIHGPRAALLAAQRFEGAWSRAHDIGPALVGILRRAADRARPGGPDEDEGSSREKRWTSPKATSARPPATAGDTPKPQAPQRLSPSKGVAPGP